MDRKGQGLPITVIIVTVLALLVLVILSLVFTGKIGQSVGQIDECKGQCVAVGECTGQYKKVDTRGVCYNADGDQDPSLECCVGI
ncbi:hypothetical protein D6774_00350 [Candidatus Woesearchaeota archaeon]|jgi:hypothetical protein|nr:MAG: hypothetical protein D6774_00350 [Candidatus Woesearchaeota archaeon]